MIEDPKERAKRWIEEYEEKKRLKERVEILEPKGQYFDGLVDAKLLTTFHLPMSGRIFTENGF